MPRPRTRSLRRAVLLATLPALVLVAPLPAGAEGEGAAPPSSAPVGDPLRAGAEVVSVVVADEAAMDRLVATGVDLVESRVDRPDGIELLAVADEREQARLEQMGFTVEREVLATEDMAALRTERAEVLETIEAQQSAADELTGLRSEWFRSVGDRTYLSVEVRSSLGTDATNVLTVAWDGGSATMERFVDAGQYLYHRFSVPVPVDDVPAEVTVTSSSGGSVVLPVEEWLGGERPEPPPHYASGFVDRYLDAVESYDRIEALAAEFPELAEIVELPYKTNGYRRPAQALVGTTTATAFYVTSRAWGHEGGNDLSIATVDPGTAGSALSVAVEGTAITVRLGTGADGAVTSTAADVVAALGASPEASALVTAATYRGNAGAGAAEVGAADLTDGLDAPASVPREPMTVKAIRIGKQRDGSKTGVFAYSQEHAREWVTPLVALETAERLLRNYARDRDTRRLVDDLDIFIMPSVNPDGTNYSMYDYNFQRRNLTNYCGPNASDPLARDAWGVDLNRNFSVGSRLDGYAGASASCTSDVYSGPGELSEPEAKNEVWLTEQNPNIRFAMNIHSHGGYFMWAPGAYRTEGRETLPRPTVMQEDYFWASSSTILTAIQQWRGTAIWPGRTGPVADVLYSAAGNSADENWYSRGIYAWNFEVGAPLWDEADQRWEAVGFQPPFAEGYEEAMEFSNGLIGLLEVARAYGRDKRPPSTTLVQDGDEIRWESSEPVTIHYTLDGSRPTYDSPRVEAAGLREGAAPVELPAGRTAVSWFAVDPAGNIEGRYRPTGTGRGYSRQLVTVP